MVYISNSGVVQDGSAPSFLSSPVKWLIYFVAEIFSLVTLFFHSLLSPGVKKDDLKGGTSSSRRPNDPRPPGGRGPRIGGFRRLGGGAAPPMPMGGG